MKRLMVRYTVKPGRAEENERYISAVFSALNAERPAGLHYGAFKLPDGVSFVHIVGYDGEETDVLRTMPAFQAFVAGVRDRCEAPPVTTALDAVGTYRLLDVEIGAAP